MIRLSVFVALFAIVVIIVFVKQSPRALPINQQNLSPDYLFSPLKNMLPIISRSPVAGK
jgi:preprotein translocase subunit SecY